MKRKVFAGIMLLALCAASFGASKQNDELKRMSTFISNFTEQQMYDFDMEKDGDNGLIHLGDPDDVYSLYYFGIVHNIINNPKSTLKACPDKKCLYGKNIMSAQAVAASVKKYFGVSIKGRELPEAGDSDFAVHYDGKNYHFNASSWMPDTMYYAEVQEVSRTKDIITMSGELYDPNNKKDRPATFTATAKPHVWNGKDTWAILSLVVERK